VSTVKNLFLGTIAAWISVGAGIVTQLLFTTIALSWWTVDDFGLWLALLVIPTLFTIPDCAFHVYMEGEFLKLGKNDPKKLGQLMSDGTIVAVLIALFELLAVLVLVNFDVFASICGLETSDPRVVICNFFAIGNAIIWLCFGAFPGLCSRMLVAIGYFTRVTWWGTVSILLFSLIPIVVVIAGGNVSYVAIAYLVVRSIYAIGFFTDCLSLIRKERIQFVRPIFVNGFRYWLRSLILVIESMSEQLRQQGIRFLLAPFSGSVGVASFVTTRSGANLALQSLNVVAGPVVPQMMRYIREKDQVRLEGMLGWLYLFTLTFFFPAVIGLQLLLPIIFPFWTRGKIDFDPVLCGTLLTSLIVFSCAQPAIVIVRSNNLLYSQLIIGVVVGIATVTSFLLFAKNFGVSAAAFAILIADIIASTSYLWIANRWLSSRRLYWPWATFKWMLTGAAAAVGILIATIVQSNYSITVGLCLSGVWLISVYQFLVSLPDFVRQKMNSYNPLAVYPKS